MGKRTGKKMKGFSCSCVHSPYENESEKVNSYGRGGRGGGLLNDVTNTKYFSLSISSEENIPTRKREAWISPSSCHSASFQPPRRK